MSQFFHVVYSIIAAAVIVAGLMFFIDKMETWKRSFVTHVTVGDKRCELVQHVDHLPIDQWWYEVDCKKHSCPLDGGTCRR